MRPRRRCCRRPRPPRAGSAVAVADGRTILVVEDNVVNQRVDRRRCSNKRGYRVECASNGREALSMLAVRSYALVFMDCQMPEMDGYAATAAIRSRERGTERLPIVAMTAHAMKGDRERCLAAGMDDYLSKPLRPEELDEALGRVFGGAPTADEAARRRGAAGPGPFEALVDEARMRVFRVDYPEIVDQLIELFVESTPPLLGELRESAESGDADAVRRSAHKLKGSCQNIGAGFMAKLAADLEVARTADAGAARRARPRVRGHPRRPARSARGGHGVIVALCLVAGAGGRAGRRVAGHAGARRRRSPAERRMRRLAVHDPNVALGLVDRDLRIVEIEGEAFERSGWARDEFLGHIAHRRDRPPSGPSRSWPLSQAAFAGHARHDRDRRAHAPGRASGWTCCRSPRAARSRTPRSSCATSREERALRRSLEEQRMFLQRRAQRAGRPRARRRRRRPPARVRRLDRRRRSAPARVGRALRPAPPRRTARSARTRRRCCARCAAKQVATRARRRGRRRSPPRCSRAAGRSSGRTASASARSIVNADLTDFRDAEVRLRRSEERHRRVVESVSDCVFETDAAGPLGAPHRRLDDRDRLRRRGLAGAPRVGVRAPRRPWRARARLRAADERRARRAAALRTAT